MSTTATSSARTTSAALRSRPIAMLLASVGIAVVLNLLVLGALAAIGADLAVTVPGGPGTITIDVIAVVVATALPLLLAGVIAHLVLRRLPALRPWVAWAGLAVALLSVIAPLTLDADATTRAGLAVMHVVAGVAWFAAITVPARRAPRS